MRNLTPIADHTTLAHAELCQIRLAVSRARVAGIGSGGQQLGLACRSVRVRRHPVVGWLADDDERAIGQCHSGHGAHGNCMGSDLLHSALGIDA